MFSKAEISPHHLHHRSSSSWILLALFASVALLFIQLIPSFTTPAASNFRTFSKQNQCPSSSISILNSTTISKEHSSLNLNSLHHLPTFSSIRVVSLESRIDRRQHMIKLAQYLNLENFHFSNAILYTDPRVLEIVQRVGNHTKADKKIAEVGHVACRLSHQAAIQAADRDDDDVTLILEDDVDMESAFKYLSGTILRDVPQDWDIIFFGHTDFSNEARNGPDPRTQNFFIYKSIEPQGGHGYALSKKGRKLVLDLLENKRPAVYQTDEGQPIDEIFVYLARLHRAELFSIIPDLIIQVPLFKSDILGTPAGFEDGMHNKKLLDSSLNQIKSLENHEDHHQPSPVQSIPPTSPISSHPSVATGVAQADQFLRTSFRSAS